MNPVAKFLVFGGAVLIVLGLLWQLGGRFLPLGRLPGDISVEKENVRFYFPIVTCLVLSVVGSLVLALFRYLSK
ncbi:hypothetical protein J31TS4_09800 [Paenibacillus sp. J31TS4]|uniref:DUF2905 domain-containing protein n=1 Tax=Paenibacillus sp. J31TS4 TaxID=2807195 RepID=UPI001B245CBF|nr:DUF2905 domain-containing protein [Paenibacillus sp. J31TS4]GIP37700.1 hypothetical protein J31TS4_09800 [Paenibacillus sp. J31TS4]